MINIQDYNFFLHVSIDYNKLSGVLPQSNITLSDNCYDAINWTVQHVLRLDDNQIGGTIAKNFCYQVQAIVLRFNKLHRSIPNDLFNCSDLGYLDLSTNRLTKMPLQDIYASKSTELVLNSNQLEINDIGIF